MRYRDLAAAAQWLSDAYGFGIHHVTRAADGQIARIVLRYADDFVLIGPIDGTVLDDLLVQPVDAGNRSTQTCYLTIKNVDEHCARSLRAGARVEIEPCDNDEGGRFYVCRDPEGHLWSFGDLPVEAKPNSAPGVRRGRPGKGSRAAVGLAILAGLVIGGGAVLYPGADSIPRAMASWVGGTALSVELPVWAQSERERRLQAERLALFANKRLAEAEAATSELTRKVTAAEAQLTETVRQKEVAERDLRVSQVEHLQRMAESGKALDDAVRAKDQASQELQAARQRAEAIQKALDDASTQLVGARAHGAESAEEAQRLRVEVARLSEARLGVEQAAEQAGARLAAAQTTEMDLREKLDVAGRELAGLRTRVTDLEAELKAARLRAEGAAETAKRELAEAQSNERALRKELTAIQAELAEVRASGGGTKVASLTPVKGVKPDVPTIPKGLESVADSPCGRAVLDRVLRNNPGTEAWQAHVLKELCEGAYQTQEPAKCVVQLLAGKVDWGGGTRWKPSNAVLLCARTQSAAATLKCFSSRVAAKESYQSAIGACAAA
jgi:uncharacterized glyoxalase superfamily protein PhnB